MTLTDTHTHLYLKEFDHDRDIVIENAMQLDVKRFFLPNIDSSSINDLLVLTNTYPENFFPMMGLHPCSVKENFEEELSLVEDWLSSASASSFAKATKDKKATLDKKSKFYAIGEIGIDLYWDKTFFKQQKAAFRKQIELAKKFKLPIVIHSRNSFDEIFNIIDDLNDDDLKGIFHCFSGTPEQAEKIIAYGGFKLGIGGVVTFKNAGLDKVVSQIDVKHIVLETDAPYLTPAPHRGKRNESAYLLHIAKKVADLHDISVEEIAEITTANSKAIFRT